jgi:hypothetical protein
MWGQPSPGCPVAKRRPARVERTLLSVAFDFDFESASPRSVHIFDREGTTSVVPKAEYRKNPASATETMRPSTPFIRPVFRHYSELMAFKLLIERSLVSDTLDEFLHANACRAYPKILTFPGLQKFLHSRAIEWTYVLSETLLASLLAKTRCR